MTSLGGVPSGLSARAATHPWSWRAPIAVALVGALLVASWASLSAPAGAEATSPSRSSLQALVRLAIGRTGLDDLAAVVGLTRVAPPPPPLSTPSPPERVVHLTFDDGPHPTYTPQVLDLLKRYGATATFFVIGRQVAPNRSIVARAAAEGHRIENHTWAHPDLTKVERARFTAEVGDTTRAITAAGAPAPTCLRPPQGKWNQAVRAWATADGLTLRLWDVDSRDWLKPGVPAIVAGVLDGIESGDVVLMHDGGGDRTQSVAALEAMLKRFKASRWRIEALSC